jgi:predicted PurR-regulated permease PerM
VGLATVAAVLAAAAETPVGALERRGWRRGLAVLAVLGGAVLVLLGALASVVPLVVEQVVSFAQAIPSLVDRAQDSGTLAWLEERFQVVSRGAALVRDHASTVAGAAIAAASRIATGVAGLVAVVAFTAFLLGSGRQLWRGALEWVHPARRPRIQRVAEAVRRAVAGYVVGALVMALVGGVVTAVSMLLLGVPYWVPLAVATAVLAVFPYIGAFVSGAVVTVTTFLAVGRTEGLVALAIFVVYQQLEGAVLQPLVQKRTVNLNPLVVAFAALVGSAAAGVYGAVMALPLAAAAKVVLEDALEERRARWRRSASREAAGDGRGPVPGAGARPISRRAPGAVGAEAPPERGPPRPGGG